jgi:hypothetical protein
MSGLLPKADIRQRVEHVCFVPLADIAKNRCSASSGRVETTGALLGGAPFWGPLFAGFRQSTPHTIGIKVLGVYWRAWLLPPGLIQPSAIDGVEAQFIDKLQDDGLGCLVIAGNRQGNAAGRALRSA